MRHAPDERLFQAQLPVFSVWSRASRMFLNSAVCVPSPFHNPHVDGMYFQFSPCAPNKAGSLQYFSRPFFGTTAAALFPQIFEVLVLRFLPPYLLNRTGAADLSSSPFFLNCACFHRTWRGLRSLSIVSASVSSFRKYHVLPLIPAPILSLFPFFCRETLCFETSLR